MKQKETLFSPHLPPLAERVRPQSLDEFIGQDHLTGKQKIISITIILDLIKKIRKLKNKKTISLINKNQ